MNHQKAITILSGAGSPHCEEYKPVYELIRREGHRRNILVNLVDYVGVGHYPDFGCGLTLPKAAKKALADIRGLSIPTESVLLCRSFGCAVGAYLISLHRNQLEVFSTVIFWGPVPFHTAWNLFASTRDSLAKINAEGRRKGVLLADDFWNTLEPTEELVKTFKSISVTIAYGAKDKYCAPSFAQYLSAVMKHQTECPVRVVEVAGAEHEVRPNADKRILDEYLELIFGAALVGT